MQNRLKEFRERAGFTQEQLAESMGCGLQHISSMERGKRTLSKKWALRAAPVLGTSWAVLMEEPSPAGLAEAQPLLDGPRPPNEYNRLPEIAEALAAKLAEDNIVLGPRRITHHAQEALRQATAMDRRLPFEERARLAVEAKAFDIGKALG